MLGQVVHDGPSAETADWPWPALQAELRYNENGSLITSTLNQWSSTETSGLSELVGSCLNWTSTAWGSGKVGNVSNLAAGGLWIDANQSVTCTNTRRLVCISQAEPTTTVTRLRSVTGATRAYWADGTYASSCSEYRFPSGSTKAYYGATGDGLYQLQVNGDIFTTYCDMSSGGRTAKSCQEIKENYPPASGSDYAVAPPGGTPVRVTCDMTTDAGGWQLMLAYQRFENTNPALTSGVPNSSQGLRHKYLGSMGYVIEDIAEVRFWCNTTAHTRTIHFKTNKSDVRHAALLGTNSSVAHSIDPTDFNTGYTALSSHNGFLPAATDLAGWSASDVFAWIPFGTIDSSTNGRRCENPSRTAFSPPSGQAPTPASSTGRTASATSMKNTCTLGQHTDCPPSARG